MKHEYAEILQAIAEDKDVRIELRYGDVSPWQITKPDYILYVIGQNLGIEIRLVPKTIKTIKIGNMDVPEPMRVAPAVGTKYWYVDIEDDELTSSDFWDNAKQDNQLLKLGICHLTEAAAREHAEALIKVSGGVL